MNQIDVALGRVSSDDLNFEAALSTLSVCLVWLNCAGDPGDKGLAAVPGRDADFRRILDTSIDYAKALNCKM